MPAKIAAGNWKMNGSKAALTELEAIAAGASEDGPLVLICPPAPYLAMAAAQAAGTPLANGAQDCHTAASGAHTGDVAAPMIADCGAGHVILGHSERRSDHGETDALVRAKTEAAWAAGLVVVLCIGESLAQREAGETLAVIGAQLEGSLPVGATPGNTIIAYEPVWAIGTGLTATTDQIAEVHSFIRGAVPEGLSILYGGSVKAANAAEIFATANVDGALVGGASLKATDFLPIVAALKAAK